MMVPMIPFLTVVLIGPDYVEDIEFGDIDNDGDLDIIYATWFYGI